MWAISEQNFQKIPPVLFYLVVQIISIVSVIITILKVIHLKVPKIIQIRFKIGRKDKKRKAMANGSFIMKIPDESMSTALIFNTNNKIK